MKYFDLKAILIQTMILLSATYFCVGSSTIDAGKQIESSSESVMRHIFPHTIMLDPSALVKAKKNFQNGNTSALRIDINQLLSEADSLLHEKASSVTDKIEIPQSGDKHDFLSLAPYRWPDPAKKDGLPYIGRDGSVNPEIYNIPDKKNLDQLTHAVTVLSSAYYFTDSPKYASKTKELLRVWFLDDSSKMKPNLKYSEMVRGKNNSQPAGIMAWRNLTDIIDSIRLIQNYPEWTSDDNSGIKSWFTRYLSWLLNSTSGRNEAQKMNNHGTYYYIQVSDIALFLNRTDLARSIIGSFMRPPSLSSFMAPELSIYSKIQPDGRQLFELQRSRALDYSMFNLLGLFKLANLGEHLELDLWNFRTGKDPLLQKALDFLIPYLTKKQDWPYSQSTQINLALASDLVCQAIAHYPQRKPMYSESYNFLARNTAFIHMDNLLPCVS